MTMFNQRANNLSAVPNPDILEMRVEVDFKDGNRFSCNGSEELYPAHDTRERV